MYICVLLLLLQLRNQRKGSLSNDKYDCNEKQRCIVQFSSERHSLNTFKEANDSELVDRTELITNMAANFKSVEKICDVVSGEDITSANAIFQSKLPSSPTLSPSISFEQSTASRQRIYKNTVLQLLNELILLNYQITFFEFIILI